MTITRFRWLAVLETVSWLTLIVAVIAKRGFGVEGATTVLGPVHGLIFLAYLAGVVFLREELRWPASRAVIAVVAAVIPFGAYLIVDRQFLSPAEVAASRSRG